MFTQLVHAKTSDLLLFCGPVGVYIFTHTDIDAEYKDLFLELVRLLRLARHKSSTPGDRAALTTRLPRVMAKLEIAMPIIWNTPVVHLLTCRTVATILALGKVSA